MQPNRKTILGAVGAVIILTVILIIFTTKKTVAPPSGNPNQSGENSPASAEPVTRETVPANTMVPAQNSNVPENIAKPTLVTPANPNNNSSYRSFDLQMQGGSFIPDTIIVREGDTTNINITAVDGNYDFTMPDYGFRKVSINRGTTKKIQFNASATGKFLFYCTTCGGPTQGPRGYVIVTSN